VATYRIHPGIGIARLGNSETDFYLAPETPAALPQACDANGNPLYAADGVTPVLVTNFKDSEGRIKRQAARFQVFAYDDDNPQGKPLKIGDSIEGGGNSGKLVDIQWQVYVANKKASWYEFDTTQGEHGYPADYPRRNADVTDRDRLIIDPGPRIVNGTSRRRASFDRTGNGSYATSFPPAELTPFSIDTLGEMMTDDSGRLLVLGGHGRSGSEKSGPGEPHTSNYANNDGWYDDTSDGPVMARLVMFAENVAGNRYVDVEYPAWVISGYPRYVPVVLDMVTMDEVLHDLAVREFADDTSLYGVAGTFHDPQRIDFHDEGALRNWLDSRLTWNKAYRPWFYRDIWPILYRPDQFRFLSNILGQSNFPHDQQQRGMFDPSKLSKTPKPIEPRAAAATEKAGIPRPRSSEMAPEQGPPPKRVVHDAQGRAIDDQYGPMRHYLFGLLRLSGEENEFKVEDKISSRLHNLPLMPLLCGDNCLTNVAPSKFLRLTDYQLFILKQWADGHFINEIEEGWLSNPPYNPYEPYPTAAPKTGRQLDRGVLSNALGGAFSPGAEVNWIMRNPSIYWAPYRIKADRSVANFLKTAAQANTGTGVDQDYTFNVENPLSQTNDFDVGLQPGDMTKYMAVPWQTDFNECTTNPTDVTYADWNEIFPNSDNDTRMKQDRHVVDVMWWPAHRPLQYNQVTSVNQGKASYRWINWSRGIQQTNAGDQKMVTDWASLQFIIRNPYLPPDANQKAPSDLDPDPRYVSIEELKSV
jgi:hypothetical protein